MKKENESQKSRAGWVDVGAQRKAYLEQLKKGNPAKLEEKKKKFYGGGTGEGREAESTFKREEVDMDAFRKAYRKYILKPVGKKPEMKDFPKGE